MGTSGNILGIGLTGLLSFQRALSATGHNIANVNTDGFSRQRVEFASVNGSFTGSGYIGAGVRVDTVKRVYDGFLTSQVRAHQSSLGQADVYLEMSTRVDDLLGDAQVGLTPALRDFFAAVQGVADDPASLPARQVLLSQAQELVDRFHGMGEQLADLGEGINAGLEESVAEINHLAAAVADLNQEIVLASGSGQPPNDLLDQRDALLGRLSEQVGISIVAQDDGALNVFIGSGQALVLGREAATLETVRSGYDPARLEVAMTAGPNVVPVSDNLSGGKLGGLLEVRRGVLDPAINDLGRVAVALGNSFNTQHRAGMDLTGQLGGDFFSVPEPLVQARAANQGSATVTAAVVDVGVLTASDYMLHFNGSDLVLTRLADNTSQTLTGTGPFQVDGLSIDVSGVASTGDSFLIRPTQRAAESLQLAINDAKAVAAAAPVRTAAAPANGGDATISPGVVLDAAHPDLLHGVRIQFNDPPTTFDVVDTTAGAVLQAGVTYVSGADIDVNGSRVQISGRPLAGDSFTLARNTGAVGDNRNALLLGALQSQGILDGATATYQQAYGTLVARVGARTAQADVNRTAQQALLGQSQQSRDAVSGVNLDEEAANLLRFQQAYQAAAQVISVADNLFETLLAAVRS